jgi:hypothetical protein
VQLDEINKNANQKISIQGLTATWHLHSLMFFPDADGEINDGPVALT